MLHSIQAYRGIAVLLVALFHGSIRVEKEYGLAPFDDWFSLGFSGVHLFFVLSGFIILMAHRQEIGVPGRLSWYLKRRLIRIYPIYWIVFLVLGGWKLISVRPDIQEFALNAFLFSSNQRLIIPVSWTLKYEIIFYAIFASLVIHRGAGTVLIAAWLGGILWSWGTADSVVLHPFNLLFIFGMAAAAASLWVKSYAGRAAGALAAAGFASGVVLFVGTAIYYSTLSVAGTQWPDHPVTILGFGLASALLVLASMSRKVEAFFEKRQLLGLIGNASYSIYLVHLWAEKNAYKLLEAVVPSLGEGVGQDRGVADALLIFLVAAAVAFGIAVHLKVERPMLAFLRRRLRVNRDN